MTADVVGKFAQTAGGDGGKAALAFHLGKSPDQVSAQETADAGNQDYQRTANTFASASHLRDGMGATGKTNYTVSQDGSLLDSTIKQASASTVQDLKYQHDVLGKHHCAEGVQKAWAKAGYTELLGSGDGWAMHETLDRDPKFVCVDRATAFDAIREGHVAIVTRQWASDPNGSGT